MNVLFEIADRDLIIIGFIFAVICIIAALIFRAVVGRNKVEPISEDERFDSDEEEEIVKSADEPVILEEKPEITEEQRKAKEELERVFMQMNADLEKKEKEKDNIDEFEKEQEENAIISYQELMAKAAKLKEEANTYETEVEQQADTKVHEAIDTYQKHASLEPVYKEEDLNKEEVYENEVEKKEPEKEIRRFKNSDIISPIYGIQKEKTSEKSSPKRQSNGIIGRAYEQTESENNLEFLNSLKEFRKNL